MFGKKKFFFSKNATIAKNNYGKRKDFREKRIAIYEK